MDKIERTLVRVATKDQIGDVETNDDFWDCECPNYFIHSKDEFSCPRCGVIAVDQPDSRQKEIDLGNSFAKDFPNDEE